MESTPLLEESSSRYGSLNADPPLRKCQWRRGPFAGFIYTALASVSFTLTSVIVKKITYMRPGQLSLVRNLGVFAGDLPIAVYCVQDVLGPRRYIPALCVRGVLGATALYLNLLAFKYLSLSEAAVVMSSLPASAALLARLYLKEPCGGVQGAAIVLTTIGVMTSVRVPEMLTRGSIRSRFDATYFVGLGSALACVATFSVTVIMLRKMKHVHFSVLMLYFGFFGAVENASITAGFEGGFTPCRCGWDVVLVMLVGVLGFLGHCCTTLAVQAEQVALVTVIRASLDIVVAMVLQAIFFGHAPDTYNAVGAGLVIVSLTLIGVQKWRTH